MTLAGSFGLLGDAGLGQWTDSIVSAGQILAASAGGTLTLGSSLFTNTGTASASAGGVLTIADAGFTNAGTIDVGAGSAVQVSLYDFYADPNAGLSVLTNAGTIAMLGGIFQEVTANGLFPSVPIVKPAGRRSHRPWHGVSPQLQNAGTVAAAGGALVLEQAISGNGTLLIDPGGTLELAAGASAGQTATFAGATGTLRLDKPSAFAGTISQFSTGDVIDLPSQVLTGVGLSNGTLVASTATQNYRLPPSAPLAGALSSGRDAHGGATITITPQTVGSGAPPATLPVPQSGMLFWASPAGDVFQGATANLNGAHISKLVRRGQHRSAGPGHLRRCADCHPDPPACPTLQPHRRHAYGQHRADRHLQRGQLPPGIRRRHRHRSDLRKPRLTPGSVMACGGRRIRAILTDGPAFRPARQEWHVAEFKSTSNYIASRDLEVAVNAAVILQRPLLVKGEPGTGKTVLAHEVASALGMKLIEWHVKSTTKAQQGLYEYDAVSRLRDGQLGDARVHDISNYIVHGKLWEAFDSDAQCVVLIDEIDKGRYRVSQRPAAGTRPHAVLCLRKPGRPWVARKRPVVIITSNNEKELPDAFPAPLLLPTISAFPDRETMETHRCRPLSRHQTGIWRVKRLMCFSSCAICPD